jgi:hypothetical protein
MLTRSFDAMPQPCSGQEAPAPPVAQVTRVPLRPIPRHAEELLQSAALGSVTRRPSQVSHRDQAPARIL